MSRRDVSMKSRQFMVFLLVLSMVLGLFGTAGFADADDSGFDSKIELSSGQEEDGDNPDGEEPGGENPDGEEPGGENPDGEEPGGENPDGENPDGGNPDGGNPDGEDPDGENPDGEDLGGEDEFGMLSMMMMPMGVGITSEGSNTILLYVYVGGPPAQNPPLLFSPPLELTGLTNEQIGILQGNSNWSTFFTNLNNFTTQNLSAYIGLTANQYYANGSTIELSGTAPNYTLHVYLKSGSINTTYTVNYEDEDGNVIYPQKNGSGKVGDSVTEYAPSITNYTLLSPSPETITLQLTGNVITFVYRLNVYNVTYDGNGADSGTAPTDNTDYLAGDTVTVLGNTSSLAKAGYNFGGWNTQADGNGTGYDPDDTFAMPAANVTLYAVWNAIDYTVTYDGNGEDSGTAPTDLNDYNVGDTVTVLGNTGSLAKAGYTFGGWNTQADGNGTSYAAGATFAMPAANVTLYAVWNAIDYTVTYDGNGEDSGDEPDDSSDYNVGDTVTVLGNTGSLVKAGYNFDGWNTQADGNGTSYAAGATFAMPAANVTLYAVWEAIDYTVTYDGNSEDSGTAPNDPSNYNVGDTVTVLGNTGSLVKAGYNFDGWNTQADGSGTSYAAGATFAMPAANVTLYAVWEAIDYTVTYDGNGEDSGDEPDDLNDYNVGDTVTVLGNTGSLAKAGYTFGGWNTQADGSGTSYAAGATFAMPAANVTLYAVWNAIDYTVTYDGNGEDSGTVPTDLNDYNVGDTVTVLGNTGSLVKAGYNFDGWNTQADGNGTSYATGATFAMPAASVTLYAVWEAIDYTVTYDGNGEDSGTAPTDLNDYNVGDTVTVLGNTGNLAKAGYTFGGWNTQADGSGTSYAAGATFAMPAANVTLYAVFEINTYDVKFFEEDGTTQIGATQTIDHGLFATAPADPTKPNHTFVGWDNGTVTLTKAEIDALAVTESADYTAVFEINTYDVRFFEEDGTTQIGATQTIDHGLFATAPADPTKPNHTFVGWDNGTVTLTKAEIDALAVTESADYTAVFEINTYTVTFVDFDGTTVLGTDVVDWNTGATAPADPTRIGYTFTGWDSDYSAVTADMTVTALYAINTYTVTFVDFNGVVLAVRTVNYGDDALAPASPSRAGYTFTGWSVPFTNITSNLTVTARYRLDPIYTLTVTIVGQGTVGLGSGTYDGGETVFLNAVSVTPAEGYEFVEWEDAQGNPISSVTMNTNTEIFAVFREVAVLPAEEIPATGDPGDTQEEPVEIAPEPVPQARTNYSWLWWLLLIPLLLLLLLAFLWRNVTIMVYANDEKGQEQVLRTIRRLKRKRDEVVVKLKQNHVRDGEYGWLKLGQSFTDRMKQNRLVVQVDDASVLSVTIPDNAEGRFTAKVDSWGA